MTMVARPKLQSLEQNAPPSPLLPPSRRLEMATVGGAAAAFACLVALVFVFFSHTFTFQLLDRPWSQVLSLLPPGSCLQFSSSVANSRSRAFGKSICAQEKVPTNLYEYALGGVRTHETDLYQARG